MAKLIDITMPASDEGTESFLERWLKKPGEAVREHEPLLEINTDKVTIEVAAPASGVLKEVLKQPNEPVTPGEVLGRIEAGATAAPPPAEKVDILMPESDEGTESFLERWLKNPGEEVREHEPLLEINTDKVTIEVAAPASGILSEILKQPNEPVQPGEVLGRIDTRAVGKPAGQSPGEEPAADRSPPRHRRHQGEEAAGEPRLSPVVRRMLETHGLDASQITGSGRGGRITAADVENFITRQQKEAAAPAPGELPARRVPHNPLRRNIARHMVESMLKTAPHVTAVFDADLSAIVAHREKHKTDFAKKGVKLTYTAYFVAAAVRALQTVPEVNSRWHEDALEIFEVYNIGIAAATDAGLIVPVIHRAETLDLLGIARKLQELTAKARAGKLDKSDLQNGTFTITNHGMTGSLIATPIINQPQSAILGIGKMEKRVVVVEKAGKDSTEIKPMVYVTLTIDHRALDGFQANQFLTKFVETLQEWGDR